MRSRLRHHPRSPQPDVANLDDGERDGLGPVAGRVHRRRAQDVVPGARFAFLLSRRGSGFITALDRRWASALYDAARAAAVSCEVVHLATKGAIRPIPPDELDALASTA